MAETAEYLWQDRKRILGMPITFTKYSLGEDRLFCQVGLVSTKYEEILLYRVRDISLKRTLGQKIFGVGTVSVMSTDKSMPTLELKNIKNSLHVKELLHGQVEKMKLERRVRIGEMMGTYDADHDMDTDVPDDVV